MHEAEPPPSSDNRAQEMITAIAGLVEALSHLTQELHRELSTPQDTLALQQEVIQLRAALESRLIIERAKGVIMAQTGCDEDAAFAALSGRSRTQRRKVREVAQEVVAAVTAGEPAR